MLSQFVSNVSPPQPTTDPRPFLRRLLFIGFGGGLGVLVLLLRMFVVAAERTEVPETPWTEPISGLNFCPPAEVGLDAVAESWPNHARCGRFGCPTRCWVTVGPERWRNGSPRASGRSLAGSTDVA